MKYWRQCKDEELDAEIRNHFDEAIRERIERGESPDEARANALREFGNVVLVKEVTRAMWGWASLERLGQDLRFGLRMLFKQPGFTLIAVVTLALGIGANTAIFSILDAWLFRPLPFKDSDQLVIVLRNDLKRPTEPAYALLYRDFEALKEQSRSFESLAGIFWRRYLLTGTGEPEELDGMIATFDLFTTLGVPALRGRTFSCDDLSGPPVTVISHRRDY